MDSPLRTCRSASVVFWSGINKGGAEQFVAVAPWASIAAHASTSACRRIPTDMVNEIATSVAAEGQRGSGGIKGV